MGNVARPNLGRVILEESGPSLSFPSRQTNMSHRVLDGSLPYVNAQLEELTSDTFSSPEAILLRHLLDQFDGLWRKLRLSRKGFRFLPPKQTDEMLHGANVSGFLVGE